MCHNLLTRWLVLVVCTCGIGMAAEPPEPVSEANEPWIVAEHLTAGWHSMALTTRRYNPEGPASVNKTPRRSLSFAGRIDVIDPNGLLGLSEVATNAKAFDEIGNPIETVRLSQYPPSYNPLKYTTTLRVDTGERTVSIVPYDITIDMQMERDAPFPLVLSRIQWSLSALLSDEFTAIDIPFAPTADWIELAPGLEVLVEEAVVSEGRYDYRIKARYDPNAVSYLDARDRPAGFIGRASDVPYSWPIQVQALPEMIVTAIDVVDAAGNSVWDQSTRSRSMGGSGDFSDSGGQRIATQYGTGHCSECGSAAFIRHIVALEPYNRELQFVLENILVPTE